METPETNSLLCTHAWPIVYFPITMHCLFYSVLTFIQSVCLICGYILVVPRHTITVKPLKTWAEWHLTALLNWIILLYGASSLFPESTGLFLFWKHVTATCWLSVQHSSTNSLLVIPNKQSHFTRLLYLRAMCGSLEQNMPFLFVLWPCARWPRPGLVHRNKITIIKTLLIGVYKPMGLFYWLLYCWGIFLEHCYY